MCRSWSVTILWEGVLLKDLIEAAEVYPEANTVIFYAYDGYSTSLPLDYIVDNNIIVAYKMNNVTLPLGKELPISACGTKQMGV